MQRNAVAPLIPSLVRLLSTSNAAAGSSVVVAPKASSGGVLSLLGFGSARVSTPLSEPLPGVPVPLRGSVPAAPSKLETSTQPDGSKLAALKTFGPVTTVALVVSGGSSAEGEATAGASKVLEAMAFKATKDRSTFRITRELEKIGAIAYAHAGRDSVTFAIDTVRLHTPEATELLLDSVLNAKLQYYEVRDNLEIVKAVLAQAMANPAVVLDEVLHRVAYDGPLGQPLLIDPAALGGFEYEALRAYHAAVVQPANLMLASYGADHAELKGLAQPLLGAAHLSASGAAPAASKYVGGMSSVVAVSPATHAALAFEAKGGLADPKTAALAAVAKALLDEARAPLPWSGSDGAVSAVSSFAHMYKASGVVGVSASSAPAQASQLIDALFKKVESVAAGVSDAQLRVAKQVALGAYKAALSSGATALPLITASLQARGKFDAAEFAGLVEGATAAQVAAFVKEAAKSTPTLVTYGSLARLPRFDSVAKRLA